MVVKSTWIPTWHQTFLSLRITRLRARDHCTPSTLVGGKGRVDPSLFHITLGTNDWNVDEISLGKSQKLQHYKFIMHSKNYME
jgi:hypothetical protein